jgi:hypothetical protein
MMWGLQRCSVLANPSEVSRGERARARAAGPPGDICARSGGL